MPSTTWLVTGASRGIGLEIVRQLLASPDNTVIAGARTPEKADKLHALAGTAKGSLRIVKLDVSDFDSIRAAAKELEPALSVSGLDYLVNNAGIGEEDTGFTVDPDVLLRIIRTNVAGPALLSNVFLPFLEKGHAKKVLNISSTVGSVASIDNFGKIGASYAISKSALNMLTAKQKLDRPDITTIAICPGWVKTELGGSNAMLEPKDSVAGILKVITGAKPEDSGKFIRFNGESIPW
ncbi:NAD-P-binding protein [Trametes meyenii]|nr:NAD-P-binding protein [Trametes meyenii]